MIPLYSVETEADSGQTGQYEVSRECHGSRAIKNDPGKEGSRLGSVGSPPTVHDLRNSVWP